MAQRLLEYNVLATREHQCHVLSCVIYLKEESNIAVSPLVWTLSNERAILKFHFEVVKLWEITVEEILGTGLVGLFPLLPLAKDGQRHEVVDEMVERIVIAEQFGLLPLAQIFSGLMLKNEGDREWLQRRFAMHKNILEESWVYQELVQRGLQEGLEKGLKEGLKKGQEEGLKEGLKRAQEEDRVRMRQAVLMLILIARKTSVLQTWG